MGGRTLPLAHSSQILPGMKVRMKSGHWDGQSDLKVTVKGTREISKCHHGHQKIITKAQIEMTEIILWATN